MTAVFDQFRHGYDDFYRSFDSPLMQRVRAQAYGRDIGQHSWVTAEQLESSIPRLKLTSSSRLLDLGCGPGGPLSFVVSLAHCRATGLEISPNAVSVGNERVARLGLSSLVLLQKADLNQPLPFPDRSFDAAISLDVVLHLQDRASLFREIKRVLAPAGRFLFTDAGVLTGSISDEEVRRRSLHGYTRFVCPGHNEHLLETAGLSLIDARDLTDDQAKSAMGRCTARQAHQEQLEELEGREYFEQEQRYLEVVAELARKRVLARMMYLVESRSGGQN